MKAIETSGKTVKDAIRLGLQELHCDLSDVDVQVLEMGSPGLFGMFGKPARVRLVMKDNDPAFDFEMPIMSLDTPVAKKPRGDKSRKQEAPKAEKKAEPKPEKKQEKKAEKPVEAAETVETAAEAPVEETAAPQKSRSRRRRSRSKDKDHGESNTPVLQPAESLASEPLPEEPFVETPFEELSETGKAAHAFLLGLTEKMGVEATLQMAESEGQLKVRMSGENMSILIGRRGETLDALQYLTSLTVNRSREDYIRVSLDTENYRVKREEALRKLALRMANRARKSGRRVALEPMNPYERRILHSALQAEPDVTTHSEGEEPYRRVIITLK